MSESQEDIDALLAEVSALADDAVKDIVGQDEPAAAAPDASAQSAVATAPPPAVAQSAPAKPRPQPHSAAQRNANIERILRLEVPVIVRLAERIMDLSEVLNLSTGAIIEFEKGSDSELDLMINNKCIGKGQAVKVGENFGLRVTHIGSLVERIKAMGGQNEEFFDV